MDKKLLDILVCPVSKTPLEYNEETNELISKASGLAYPVRDDIPVLLENEARELSAEERESK
ncbi:Trm112 family protein [Neptuniibacter sp.]|uniref:Trm112 family protein n=1 Tax=Neptuniibacter sp. TaxID=1962643 RepID=UPI00263060DE|nr:Trm112 family protein [Neptuniibacter sp.]MCP4596836.1 Trm112 family protein [Neptuniibacter sp.]